MVNEHALTIKEKMTREELTYMIKKANRLGLQKRQILNVFSQDDSEGHHIYFETDALLLKDTTL